MNIYYINVNYVIKFFLFIYFARSPINMWIMTYVKNDTEGFLGNSDYNVKLKVYIRYYLLFMVIYYPDDSWRHSVDRKG